MGGDYGPNSSVEAILAKISEQENAYQIPVGGSNALGAWGYIEKWEEMTNQGILDEKANIFVPTGSGGTAAGIIIGNYLTGNRHVIYLLQVADPMDKYRGDIENIINISGLNTSSVMEKTEFVPAIGKGYAQSDPEELQFLKDFAIATGIALDRVYTGKAAKQMFCTIKSQNLDGKSIFIHTGGIHSLSDQTATTFIQSSYNRA